ncbi:MAG: hypothetical protein ACRDTF_09380 [Pseudonocardiaceae bacterium]
MAWTTVTAPAPLRQLTLGVTEVGVAYLSFAGGGIGRLSAIARRIGTTLVVHSAWTDPAARQLGDYLTGARRTFDVPLDWRLTSGVQRSVLSTLYGTVGYGDTITYGELVARPGGRADAQPRLRDIMRVQPSR